MHALNGFVNILKTIVTQCSEIGRFASDITKKKRCTAYKVNVRESEGATKNGQSRDTDNNGHTRTKTNTTQNRLTKTISNINAAYIIVLFLLTCQPVTTSLSSIAQLTIMLDDRW
jgi:hypothetical protein